MYRLDQLQKLFSDKGYLIRPIKDKIARANTSAEFLLVI